MIHTASCSGLLLGCALYGRVVNGHTHTYHTCDVLNSVPINRKIRIGKFSVPITDKHPITDYR